MAIKPSEHKTPSGSGLRSGRGRAGLGRLRGDPGENGRPSSPGTWPPPLPLHLLPSGPWVEVAGRRLPGRHCFPGRGITPAGRAGERDGRPAAGVLAGCEGWGLPSLAPCLATTDPVGPLGILPRSRKREGRAGKGAPALCRAHAPRATACGAPTPGPGPEGHVSWECGLLGAGAFAKDQVCLPEPILERAASRHPWEPRSPWSAHPRPGGASLADNVSASLAPHTLTGQDTDAPSSLGRFLQVLTGLPLRSSQGFPPVCVPEQVPRSRHRPWWRSVFPEPRPPLSQCDVGATPRAPASPAGVKLVSVFRFCPSETERQARALGRGRCRSRSHPRPGQPPRLRTNAGSPTALIHLCSFNDKKENSGP